jgi:hypothetical protein
VENISLEQGVIIQSISQNNLSINFKPPSPTITIDGLSLAAITLALQQDPTKTKVVQVNSVGLIEVQ